MKKKNPAPCFNSAEKAENRADVFNHLNSGLGSLRGKKVLLLPASQGHEIPMYRLRGVKDSDFYLVDKDAKVLAKCVKKHKLKGAHLFPYWLDEAVPHIRETLNGAMIDIANLDTCQTCDAPLRRHINAVLNGGILSFEARFAVTFVDARMSRRDWHEVENERWVRQTVANVPGWSINYDALEVRNMGYQNDSPMRSIVMQLHRIKAYVIEEPVIEELGEKPAKLPKFLSRIALLSSGHKAGVTRQISEVISAHEDGEKIYLSRKKPRIFGGRLHRTVSEQDVNIITKKVAAGHTNTAAADFVRPGEGVGWFNSYLYRNKSLRKKLARLRKAA